MRMMMDELQGEVHLEAQTRREPRPLNRSASLYIQLVFDPGNHPDIGGNGHGRKNGDDSEGRQKLQKAMALFS
jgi:hypothetical protein